MKYSNPVKTSSAVHPAVLHQCPKRARKQQQQQQQQQPQPQPPPPPPQQPPPPHHQKKTHLKTPHFIFPMCWFSFLVPPTFVEKSLRGDEVETPRGIVESLRGAQLKKKTVEINGKRQKKNGEKKGEPNKLLIFCPLFVFLLGGEGAWKMEGVCF